MALYRYQVVSIRSVFDEEQWALIRERYAGRAWPCFWRALWLYDCCVGVYATRAEADAALATVSS